ncbi:transcriptional regulator BetI [Roseovarius aestuarii]|uniref:HTH-type transcriptional regulator BetI n=1 Tax=Roseovarius aestuarii TaxID=475083 RepID=A0A1X7BP31_9RHOB|nr:transcriptional regulator BetI [Roseovarius aestuarii]SMC11385.1 HTH-type transcriptional regulator BetI [Roseovarius aestuarii]
MRSTSIRSIRRAELSRAAFEAVVRYGLRGTTLDKVGEIAGVSKGVVLHHFKDKSALLEAVFRRSNSLLSESAVELYRYAETPYERFWAIIVANFCDTIFNRRVCQAWVSLISEVPHNDQCQRIQYACNERIRTNLEHELKHFLSPDDTKRTARHLGMLIDGVWVRAGLMPDRLTSAEAISEMEYAVAKLLPYDEISATKHKEARKKIETIADIALGSKAFKEKSLQV